MPIRAEALSRITTYQPAPIALTHGKGCWVYDEAGKAYFDSFSGIAVTGLGHAHPEVVKCIQAQAAKVLHTSNAFHIRQQEQLAERLCQKTGLNQAFFSNSGAEANETALKLARLYGHQKGISSPSIIVMERAFHGRTLATLSASGSRKIQAGFEPLMPGFIRAPFNDIAAIQTIAAHRKDVVAVFLEPIQGEAGVIPADESYLRALREVCDKNQWLYMLDEVQTGNGRCGDYFAFMAYGFQPDVVTTAKGLGNGVPIGVCLMGERASNLFKPGNHGSTFGGNPLACATALSVLDVIEKETLCERAQLLGLKLKKALQARFASRSEVVAIRGKGLMLGIELDRPAAAIKPLGLEEGLLLNVTAERVVRLLPPLTMSDEECDELIERLTRTLLNYFK